MKKSHPIIAKEGWLYLAISILATIIIYYLSHKLLITLPFILISVFVLQFFRDPNRQIVTQDVNAILSPADGRIICIENATDPYRNTEALKISIFMNVFNVHSNCAPASGIITGIKYNTGKFINASFNKASSDNERNAILLTLDNKNEITVVQIAGLIARRIMCYAQIGQQIKQGDRYGFIRFGSRVDVYLPPNYKPSVVIGQKVNSIVSTIATIS